MRQLELLAPARDTNIGIAAIDCGADAVYIAGPEFGARQAAGNSIEDIRRLCAYAHNFGARIFITLNTILFDSELEAAGKFMREAQDAGADAFIVQDPAVMRLASNVGVTIPMHASTQCAIRTPDKAAFYASMGMSRLVLERQMSLEQIREIRGAVDCELEFFVHGALCVCYSGQCYLSENIAGRSANRGACIQACRSRYDLADAEGNVLVRNKALLSLKDYSLKNRLGELAEAGICSFKIEGRLKNISYVRNVVREYSQALDALVASNPDKWKRASYGKVVKGFTPDPSKTFNRGYTELFIDGRRGRWAAMDTPKSMGEEIGTVAGIRPSGKDNIEISVKPAKGVSLNLANGDGFSFATDKEVIGFRGDVCIGNTIRCRRVRDLKVGARLWRNISVEFEKALETIPCERVLRADVAITIDSTTAGSYMIYASASSEDGRRVKKTYEGKWDEAKDAARMADTFHIQISKKTGHYKFTLTRLDTGNDLISMPFLSASEINGIRRDLAIMLNAEPCRKEPMAEGDFSEVKLTDARLSYKYNVANRLARMTYESCGADVIDEAYELSHAEGAELMRSKYCIRYELGMCPKFHKSKDSGPLFLLNNGRRLRLGFDCRDCEMTVTEA